MQMSRCLSILPEKSDMQCTIMYILMCILHVTLRLSVLRKQTQQHETTLSPQITLHAVHKSVQMAVQLHSSAFARVTCWTWHVSHATTASSVALPLPCS
jgi:hypothetical protein